MITILPGILERDAHVACERIEQLQRISDWVHVDIADGVLVANTTWQDPVELRGVVTANLEVHMMVENPTARVAAWVAIGAKRITAHIEAFREDQEVREHIAVCRQKGVQVGLAINPDTPLERVEPHVSLIDLLLCMGSTPGFSGRKLQERVIERIQDMHARYPALVIGIDIGVNEETAPRLVAAGARVLVATSYIKSFADPGEGMVRLQKAIS